MQQGNSRENCKNNRVKYGAGAWASAFFCVYGVGRGNKWQGMDAGEGIKRQGLQGEGINILKKFVWTCNIFTSSIL